MKIKGTHIKIESFFFDRRYMNTYLVVTSLILRRA